MKSSHVVIQTAFIGDLFLSIPTLSRLRKKNPQHQIILVCKKGLKDFFLQTGLVDQAYEVEKGQAETYRDVLKKINLQSIDTVYCFHQSVRSTLFSFQIKAKKRIGFVRSGFFSAWKRMFFSNVVLYRKAWPDVIRQMSLLSAEDLELQQYLSTQDWGYLNQKSHDNGFAEIPPLFQFPILPVSAKSEASDRKRIALFPGSVWATKKWTTSGFADLAKRLVAAGHQVIVMGAPADQADSIEVCQAAPGAIDQTGKMSLLSSVLELKNFDLIICNDSAPAHMAAALQRPVLCVFGPTVLDFGFRPWNDKSKVIEIENMACRPCGPHGHHKCPLSHHNCMKNISGQVVYSAALEMLGGNK